MSEKHSKEPEKITLANKVVQKSFKPLVIFSILCGVAMLLIDEMAIIVFLLPILWVIYSLIYFLTKIRPVKMLKESPEYVSNLWKESKQYFAEPAEQEASSGNSKAGNIEKGKRFKSFINRNMIASILIAIIAIVALETLFDFGASALLLIIPVILISLRIYYACKKECPECAAFGDIDIESELISETFLGNDIKENLRVSYNDKKYRRVAVFNRTYDNHADCNYCGHQWTFRTTKREEEDL